MLDDIGTSLVIFSSKLYWIVSPDMQSSFSFTLKLISLLPYAGIGIFGLLLIKLELL